MARVPPSETTRKRIKVMINNSVISEFDKSALMRVGA